MVTDLEVAQVLEDAATMYEDEKIEWCINNWARKEVRLTHDPDGNVKATPVITMCAEGALLAAAGFTLDQLLDFQYTHKAREGYLVELDFVAFNKFNDARRSLIGAIGGYVTTWNDHMPPETGKERVVATMREVAKDLRNRAPAEEL